MSYFEKIGAAAHFHFSRAISSIAGVMSNWLRTDNNQPNEDNTQDSYSLGDIAIGTTSVDVSAALELGATDKGFLVNRLTSAERNAIVSPAKGLLIFNTSTNRLEFNSGTPATPYWTSSRALPTVNTYADLPTPSSEYAGVAYVVENPSGGTVVLGVTFGGQDSGTYVCDGTSWGLKPVGKISLDAGDVQTNSTLYQHSNSTDLSGVILDLESEINTKTAFLTNVTSFSDSNYQYKIGLRGTEWIANRYLLSDNSKTTASISNNASITTKALAEANFSSLNYS